MAQSRPDDGRPLTELFKDLAREVAALVRQEIALARVEVAEKITRVGRRLATLAIGAIAAVCGGLFVLLGASHGVTLALAALGMGAAAAGIVGPLVVGVVVLLAAWGMVVRALRGIARERIVPERTARTLNEEKAWLNRKLT